MILVVERTHTEIQHVLLQAILPLHSRQVCVQIRLVLTLFAYLIASMSAAKKTKRKRTETPKRQHRTISKRMVDACAAEGKNGVFCDRDLPGFGCPHLSLRAHGLCRSELGAEWVQAGQVGWHGVLSADQARKVSDRRGVPAAWTGAEQGRSRERRLGARGGGPPAS